jgi:hypothetical protein
MAVHVTDTAAAPSAASFRRPAPKPLLERLGDPGPEHLAHTRALLASVPTTLKDAARDLPQARALVYALLASPRADVWELQARTIERADGREALGHATAFRGELARVDARVRIPLSEVLTGTLGNLDSRVYDAFRRTVIQLAEADGELDLHEWILSGLVLRYLDGRFGRRRQARARYSRLSGLEREIACVLSVLAHSGSGDSEAARKAFGKAASELRLDAGHMTSPEGTGPRVLEAALATLAELVPQQKKRFLAACATAIAADGRVASREAELFCVIAIWLDCPAPPLLPDQRLV